MRVFESGDGLAVALPEDVVQALGLKEGDDVDVRIADDGKLEVRRSAEDRRVVDRLDKFRGSLPADFKFDREEANRRR